MTIASLAAGERPPPGWRLENVRRLPEPIPAKGALGIWALPDDVELAVTEALRG